MLTIRALGPFELLYQNERIALKPRSHAHLLLALLLLHHGRRVDRSRLAGQLWPDLPEDTARRKLSDTLYQLRKWLPSNRFQANHATITLTLVEEDECDLLEIERLLANPEPFPSSALLKVTDPYLFPELDHEWALLARESLRLRYLDRLEREATQTRERGELDDALALLRHLHRLEPLRESGQRALLELLASMGRPAEAIELYKQLCQRLKTELGIAPSSKTEQVYRALLQQTTLDTGPERVTLPQELPLVGREAERNRVLGWLAYVSPYPPRAEPGDEERRQRARPQVILLEGRAGIGKSRLLAVLSDDVSWRNWQVASGKPTPGASALENVLRSLLTPLRAEEIAHYIDPVWVARLLPIFPELARWLPTLPDVAPVEGAAVRVQRQEAIYLLLTALTRHAPLLLLLDDMHLAEAEALTQLAALATAPLGILLAVIVSYRPGPIRDDPPRWQALQALDTVAGERRLTLAPLTTADVGRLLYQILGSVTPPTLERFYAITAGHPLFIREALAILLEQETLQCQADGVWQLDPAHLETIHLPSVTSVILDRVSRLPATETDLLTFSALHEGELSPSLLTTLTGYPLDLVLQSAKRLVNRRLWQEGRHGYHCAHDLIRQALLSRGRPLRVAPTLDDEVAPTLDDEERRKRHVILFQSLKTGDYPAATLSHHAFAGGLWAEAIPSLAQAGAEARERADFHAAANHLSKALAVLSDGADLPPAEVRTWRIRLLFERQRLWQWLGEPEAQAEDLAALDRLLSPDDPARVEWQGARAQWLLDRGELHAARELATSALATASRLAKTATDFNLTPITIRLHMLLGKAAQRMGEVKRALEQYHTARRLAETHSEIELLIGATGNLAIYDHFRGDFPAAKAKYAEIRQLAESHGLVIAALTAHGNLGAVNHHLGDDVAAIAHYEHAITGYERHARVDPFDLNNLADIYIWLGAFNRAEALLDRAQLLYLARQDSVGQAGTQIRQGVLALERLQPAQAQSLLNDAAQTGESSGDSRISGPAYTWLGLLDLEEGAFERAEEGLAQATTIFKQMGVNFFNAILLALKANLAARRGAHTRIPETLAQAEAELPYAWYPHRAQYYLGLAAQAGGEEALAAKHFTAAYATLQMRTNKLPADLADSLLAAPRNRRLYWAARRVEVGEIVGRVSLTRSGQAIPADYQVVELPYSGAPLGRPLNPWEKVPILWEIPPDSAETDSITARQVSLRALIEQALAQEAYPTVAALAQFLGVSLATISRDLQALRATGEVLPTRGT